MFRPTPDEMVFIALFLEGLLYGLYSGVFAIYLQYHTSKQDISKTQNRIFYSMCALYVLSASVFVCDTAVCIGQFHTLKPWLSIILIVQLTLFACCDFIAQLILIYRCWIVWGRNIRVVIIPLISSVAFLAIWLASGSSSYIFSEESLDTYWGYMLSVSGLSLSLTVNALVTALIVFRIFKVFREVKATSDDQILGATGGNKLRRVIFILVESGMALFSIQLTRLVVTVLQTDTAIRAFGIIVTIHQMLNGITPTIILVRTSMGLSFHDETSMEEVAIGSLCFASGHANSVPEMGNSIVHRDIINDDDDDIDIDVVGR